jgi:hypothetical protein
LLPGGSGSRLGQRLLMAAAAEEALGKVAARTGSLQAVSDENLLACFAVMPDLAELGPAKPARLSQVRRR